ncbi:type II CAAX endopeptidase family protein [Alkaliphilus serpentinus]|uniref:CPBP family intramembrane metalloprotease n=1 Tax=Alkaliphilus serpentinus TaxID=1482731 RepID=A0A833HNR0_9FIRM|nr:type II CAAX endopeptidase family protein [Alkaliphilus serpentinus]KAB3529828.1 CPBP family intramembrane metalloprotease [Alkaliphilus serpentinus]
MKEKVLKVIDSNILYFIGAYLFVAFSLFIGDKSFSYSVVIIQLLVILLPPIIYIKIKGLNLKKTLRLNKIRVKHGFLIIAITLLIYPLAVVGNAIMMLLLSLLGNLNIPELPSANNTSEYLFLMILMAVTPGICEEVFFRGFVLSGYERLGQKKAIIFSSVLFGIFHFNLYNLMGPIVIGVVFAYLVTITDSIFAGIIGHIANNGFAVTLNFLLNKLMKIMEDIDLEGVAPATEEVSTTIAMLSSVVVFAIIATVTVFIAILLIKIIKKDMAAVKNKELESDITIIEDEDPEIIDKQPRAIEYFPLLLVTPILIYIIYFQISEIISLG